MIFRASRPKIVPGAALVSSSSPIHPVVDHLADLAPWEAELAADPISVDAVDVDPLSVTSPLLERLREVADPRRLRGLRHPLLVTLVLTACATPAGLLPAAAIDGKLLHGSRTKAGQVFLVAVVSHHSGAVLGQRQVGDKRGENTVVAELLTPLGMAGMMLTFDALHTTKKTARLITGTLGAHYTLILKGNQPLALQAAQGLQSGTDTEFTDHMDIDEDRGHGRTERRTLRVAACDDTLFPGARQVFRLRRDTGGLDGVRTSKEIIYGIVSVTAEQAGPEHLNHYVRGHWAVEIVSIGPGM